MSNNKRSRKLLLGGPPLQNITSSLNCPTVTGSKMSYTDDSGFPNLTNSPMSSLAFNLSELSTGRSTPRRCLSLSDTDTPPNDGDKSNPRNIFSAESGCFSESPLDDSPTLVSLNAKRLASVLHCDIPLEAFSAKKKTIAFRRISSEPLPTLRLDSPTGFLDENNDENAVFSPDDANSEDSGLGMEKRSLSMSSFDEEIGLSPSKTVHERLPSLDDLWNSEEASDFKAPKGKPPKRSRSISEDRVINEDTCSPIKYSPVKSSLPRPSFAISLFSENSPKQEASSSKSRTEDSDSKSNTDDGFQELFDVEDLHNEASDQVSSLMSAPLLHENIHERPDESLSFLSRNSACIISKRVKFNVDRDKDATPTSRVGMPRRIFQRSQSLDIRPRLSSKRSEPPEEDCFDFTKTSKRLKGDEHATKPLTLSNESSASDNTAVITIPCMRRLQRCHSETEATIKSAVSRMAMEPNLIGDCSKPYCLPVIKGKHQDLKSISSETMSRILAHDFDDVLEEYYILDCRYPYEYEGGHIKNALNIYTHEGMLEKFLKSPIAVQDPNKRIILIFHCEFSSERAPKLSRFVRRHDRETNKECYPFLHYPEMYLLDGGYKNFFEHFDYLCEPRQYRTMLDKDHADDLRKFRGVKSKSWDEKSHGRCGIRKPRF